MHFEDKLQHPKQSPGLPTGSVTFRSVANSWNPGISFSSLPPFPETSFPPSCGLPLKTHLHACLSHGCPSVTSHSGDRPETLQVQWAPKGVETQTQTLGAFTTRPPGHASLFDVSLWPPPGRGRASPRSCPPAGLPSRRHHGVSGPPRSRSGAVSMSSVSRLRLQQLLPKTRSRNPAPRSPHSQIIITGHADRPQHPRTPPLSIPTAQASGSGFIASRLATGASPHCPPATWVPHQAPSCQRALTSSHHSDLGEGHLPGGETPDAWLHVTR